MIKKTVLIAAAHPDDEVLGCGGTIARHAAAGDAVHVLFLSDGVSSRGSKGLKERQAAAKKAAKILGIASVTFGKFPDNKMDSVPLLGVVKKVEEAVVKLKPQVVYTHHSGDLNIDHRITAEAVMTACRPQKGHPVRAIYGFQILSSTEWQAPDPDKAFLPSRFVDISATLEKKIKALQAYGMEMRPFPHSRSFEAVRAQAVLHGAQNGMKAAEAFTVLRQLES